MPADDGTAAEAHARISTHILDTGTGDPAGDVYVRLERHDADGWSTVAEGRSDGDGRLRFRVPMRDWQAGGYRLLFYVEPYLGQDCFFPEIMVAFHVRDPDRQYHVPLLLNRYGYTTYRGS
ncbi:5-hydroxyisourate hydrolase [Actinoplanes sp. SE50]|uniref:hydroxyisourate hydrolase n=1 Tax=unclassified Actinoplanes TaxID=2626549 RepID=UPI00023EBFD3|nr:MULTISPECIES: hydroxyisourate hydrolase [unclassified Actinoplanes]AEV87495.1 Transthyretin [Actinoplanes sp. SE50/110]ATO85898.1 5-hydroxyisourate hydrolase [Actinoplanes sp. SE50]SLM03312.1 hydroxyisourate hydrolase [Actinoplanes sp. SE50/110]